MKWEQFDCLGRKKRMAQTYFAEDNPGSWCVETLIPCVFNSCIPWKKHVKTLMFFKLQKCEWKASLEEWKLQLNKVES